MTRLQRQLVVGVVIAAALATRWFHLQAQSVWYDEAVVLLFAGKGLGWIFTHISQDTMPPLHYLLLHFWLGLGRQEGVTRGLPFLFSTGSIPLAYLLARRLFGHRVALLATLLAVVSPFQIYFAQEARMYAQLSFFSLAATYFFLRAWQEGGRWLWLGFALSSVGAVYTHNLGLLTLFGLDAFALAAMGVRGQWSGVRGQEKENGRHSTEYRDHRVWGLAPDPRPSTPNPHAWLAANGLVALAYAPWLPVLWQQANQVKESFWLAAPGPEAIVTTMYSFVFAHSLTDSLFGLGLFLVVLTVFLGIYHLVRRPGDERQAVLFCLAMLLLPLVASFALSFVRPIYLDRSLIGSSFFLYVFLAWSVLRLRPDWLRLLLGGALAVTVLASLYGYYFVPTFAKPPMREAAMALAGMTQPNDAILHTSDGSFLPFIFYQEPSQRQGQNKLIAGDPELSRGTPRDLALSILGLRGEEVDDLVADKERIWLVVALDHSADWQLGLKRWFDQRYRMEDHWDFQGIRIFLYVRAENLVA